MKAWLVEYNEQNSGGRWRMKSLCWTSLRSAGWDVYSDASPKHATKVFGSKLAEGAIVSAMDEWESLTGLDSSDPGCDCCGPPHAFMAECCGDTMKSLAELEPVPPDMKGLKRLNMDGRTSCAKCGNALLEPYAGIRHFPTCEK